MNQRVRAASLATAVALLAGCSAFSPAGLAGLSALFAVPVDIRNLEEPLGIDWQTSRYNYPGLGEKRKAFVEQQLRSMAAMRRLPGYALQAATTWDTAPANWGATGVAMSTMNTSAVKVTSALGCGLYWDSASARRCIYALTDNGLFLRIPSDQTINTTNVHAVDLDSGTTASTQFQFSAVTINPTCTRAYVLRSDVATMYSIDLTDPGTLSSPGSLSFSGETGGGKFMAPVVDPILSAHDGTRDTVYVPLNNGKVFKVHATNTGTLSQLASKQVVPSSSTALSGCDGCSDYNYKLAAPGLAFNHHFYVGDTAGVFHDYNFAADQDATYAISTVAPIAAAPALELQSGNSGTLYDSTSSATVTLGDAAARYAFVNITRASGPACAMIDLARKRVTLSPPLYLDEFDSADAVRGSLNDYDYQVASSNTTVLSLTSGNAVTVATDTAGDLDSGTAGTQNFLGNRLQAASTGVPSTVYLRADASSIASTAVFNDAEVRLAALETRTTAGVPVFYGVGGLDGNGSTGYYQRGSQTTWDTTTNALGPANAPTLYQATIENSPPRKGFSESNAAYGATTQVFTADTTYTWRVLDALAGPTQMDRLALGMRTTGNYGTGANDTPSFSTSATAALAIQHEIRTHRPNFPVETAPIIDSLSRRVYVLVSNVLFCLKYNDEAAWSDTEYNATHVNYQALQFGRTYSSADDGTKDSSNVFYRNKVTPAAAFDFSYVFGTSYKSQGSNWHFAISRVQPGRLGSSGTRTTDDLGSSDLMATNSINSDGDNQIVSGTLSSPESGRFMLISPYDNVFTTGGDLFMTFTNAGGAKMVRFGASAN